MSKSKARKFDVTISALQKKLGSYQPGSTEHRLIASAIGLMTYLLAAKSRSVQGYRYKA